jgi:hypothetical protein
LNGIVLLEFPSGNHLLTLDMGDRQYRGFVIDDIPCESEHTSSLIFPAMSSGPFHGASTIPGCYAEGLAVPATPELKPAPPIQPELRVLYFVPGDLIPDAAQAGRILQASKDVHRWYADHTDFGRTLVWAGSVEQVIGFNTVAYYSVDFWGRVLGELSSRSYPIFAAQKVFAIWVKGAGQWAGGAQVANFGGAALLGGEIFIEDGCVPTHPSLWPCTPAGAMAHEVGHGLGLPHPDSAGTWFGVDLNSHSLMGSHWNFPERYSRNWTPDSPWGFLNYERDVERYNPLVSVVGSPYPVLPGDPMQKPDLPNPSLNLMAALLSSTQTQLSWNLDGASQYYAYWSTSPDFSNYTPVSGSPTSGTSLNHTDAGMSVIYFKAFEIPLRQ